MDRRGFIKGLGALLATSALVKPEAPVLEAWTTNIIPPLPDGNYVSICHPSHWRDLSSEMNWLLFGDHPDYFRGSIGKYLNLQIMETKQAKPIRSAD